MYRRIYACIARQIETLNRLNCTYAKTKATRCSNWTVVKNPADHHLRPPDRARSSDSHSDSHGDSGSDSSHSPDQIIARSLTHQEKAKGTQETPPRDHVPPGVVQRLAALGQHVHLIDRIVEPPPPNDESLAQQQGSYKGGGWWARVEWGW